MTFSFCIITYKRPSFCIDAVSSILNINNYDKFTNEIIILNNDFNDLTLKKKYLNQNGIKVFNSKENLGVSKGRNFLAKKATNEILIFLDDDAEFERNHNIFEIILSKYKSSNVMALAFKSNNFYNHTLQKKENPPHNITTKNASHFVGVGHSIRKSVFISLGGYQDDFFYGCEEHDLSYGIFRINGVIKYVDEITVLHKKSSLGRLDSSESTKLYAINKLKLAYKNLPSFFFYSHLFFWTLYLIKNKVKNPFQIIRSIKFHKIEKNRLSFLKSFQVFFANKRNIFY